MITTGSTECLKGVPFGTAEPLLLGRRYFVHVIAHVCFRNAAIIDYGLVWSDRHLNAAYTFFTRLHQHPDNLLAGRSLNDHRYFRSGMTAVLDGCGDQVALLLLAKQRPRICRLDVKLRQAAIAVYPVVEEPFEIALRVCLNQLLKIAGVLVG